MNVTSNVSAITTQVSGAVTIASASASKTAGFVASSAPSPEVVETTGKVIISSEWLALGSFVVMIISLIWNQYSNRRRDKLIRENHVENQDLRREELALKREEFEYKKKDQELRERQLVLQEKEKGTR